MVYELLWDCFVPDDFANGFDLFFEICGHIVRGHVPPSISCLFFALKKQSRSIRPIVINDVTYHLVVHTLVIQCKDTFLEHFNLHQFGVTTCGRCEIMVHGVRMMLNLHPNWVVLEVDVHNSFNSMSLSTIFQELWFSLGSLYQLFPFVWQFYACPSLLYFSQASRHEDLIVISS
jgi:hypothetical protein